MTKLDDYIQHVRKSVEADIITNDDGYKVWWPEKINGYHTEFDLRHIADYLEELNKEWDEEVKEYFANQR